MLLRNKNYCPDTNVWHVFFCQPKANSARTCNLLHALNPNRSTVLKTVGLPWKERIVGLEVDKWFYRIEPRLKDIKFGICNILWAELSESRIFKPGFRPTWEYKIMERNEHGSSQPLK